jgi:murein DD-endopeptidase MepM/ murein hydrolase activator NlpD
MRFLIRALLFLIVIGVLVLGGAWVAAGFQEGPTIEIRSPEKYVGQNVPLEFFVTTPGAQPTRVEAALEQEGQQTPLFSLDPAQAGNAQVKQEDNNRMWVIRPIGRQHVPTLKQGPARITITAAAPVMYGLRTKETTVTRDIDVRLDPPRVGVMSLHHFVNHGGAEFVVFRATPQDVEAGVRVGNVRFPSFPGSAVGIKDPAARIAFFVLGYDQDINSPIQLYARDVASNEVSSPIERRVFPKPFAQSKIPVDDPFLQRVVPAIASSSPNAGIDTSNLVAGFVKINGELRRQNNESIAALAAKTRPEMLWRDAWTQMGNSAVQSRFADYRTYFYKDKEIDRQVHLGFDLASLQHAPVLASNRGVVVYANDLGIYGNCVILDHGLGVQSLYAHLSTMEVKEGQTVDKGHVLGRTGITGLAGGDHLHYTMLVNGVAVNPVEWWDPHWMEDRVFRKIREAGGQAPTLK